MRERHLIKEYFYCPVSECGIKFIHRNYLKEHLKNIHKLGTDDARTKSYQGKKHQPTTNENRHTHTENLESCRPKYTPVCEDISDDENIIDSLDINEMSDFLNSFSNQELGLNQEKIMIQSLPLNLKVISSRNCVRGM